MHHPVCCSTVLLRKKYDFWGFHNFDFEFLLRLMEFNQLISRYLVRDPESRKRNLHIRSYAVIPLNEECGLIEWIPNLIGLRHILNRIYKEKGLQTTNQDLKRLMPQIRDTLPKKKEIFIKGLLQFLKLLRLSAGAEIRTKNK